MKQRLLFFFCALLFSSAQIHGQIKYELTPTMTATLDSITGVMTISTTKAEGEAMPDYFEYGTVPYYEVRYTIQSVVIKDKVTTIGAYAFANCASLTSITTPNSVTLIGAGAFNGCSSLTSIIIPNSITEIGAFAFGGCSSLTSITLPNSVTTIGENTFFNCSSLTSIIIPNSVTTIGSSAFGGCSNLTSITIPNSVTTIGQRAFSNCNGLTSITIPSSIIEIGSQVFSDCSSLTSITIPNSVTTIGAYAFANCISLTSITIPNSVTSIGSGAFSYCSSLTSITIPNSVTTIGLTAFSYCTNLTDIMVEWTTPLTISVSAYIFLNINISAATLHVPAGTKALYQAAEVWKDFGTIVEKGAASPCENPTASGTTGTLSWTLCPDGTLTISGEGEMPDYEPFGMPWNNYFDFITNVIINEGVSNIGNEAFDDCTNLISVSIPNSVTIIGDHAFSGCKGLTSVIIPSSVTIIGSYAFDGCYGLTSITIPNSVTTIELVAFRNCSALTSVTIPNSVSNIAVGSFSCCKNLIAINVAADNPSYSSVGGVLFSKDQTRLVQCPGGITSYDIPNSVTTIGTMAFYGCYDLTSVTIPNSVTTIEYQALAQCRNLIEITNQSSTPQTIDNNTFFNVDITKCTLHVPVGTKALYQAADVWKDFGTIDDGTTESNKFFDLEADGHFNLSGTALAIFEASFTDRCLDFKFGNDEMTPIYSGDNLVGYRAYANDISDSQKIAFLTVYKENRRYLTAEMDNLIPYYSFSITYENVEYFLNVTADNGNNSVYWTALSSEDITKLKNWEDFPTFLPTYKFCLPYQVAEDGTRTDVIYDDATYPAVYLQTLDFLNDTNNPPFLIVANSSSKDITARKLSDVMKDGKADLALNINTMDYRCVDPSKVSSWIFGRGLVIPPTTVPVTGIALNKKTLTIEVNNTEQLTATVLPADATNKDYIWGTSNNNVTVVDGLVTGVSEGTVYVFATITDGNTVFADTCSVTVTAAKPEPIPVAGVSLDVANLSLEVNQTGQLTATVMPANADNQTVYWASDDNGIATVSSAGLVTGVAEGRTTITVVTEDGSFTATCNVEVIKPDVEAEEEQPVGDNGKGKMTLSLTIPANSLFSGSFLLTLPAGMHLDLTVTQLTDSLRSALSLTIVQNADSSWLFTITPLSLRSAKEEMVYSRIVEIGYTVDEAVTSGTYEATISDLSFEFDNGTTIEQEELPVPVTVNRDLTSIENIGKTSFSAVIFNNTLRIDSPQRELISVYSVTGSLIYSVVKDRGPIEIPIPLLRGSVLIVKGSESGSVKVINYKY